MAFEVSKRVFGPSPAPQPLPPPSHTSTLWQQRLRMREVMTVSLGGHANFVNAHFWNFQVAPGPRTRHPRAPRFRA